MKKNAQKRINKTFLFLSSLLVLLAFSCSTYIDDNSLVKPLENQASSNSLFNPVATVESPLFMEGGVPKNRRLIISFSKAMDRQTFWDKLIITDSMGKNLKDYFCPPQWSNEDTLVEIAPDLEKFIDLKNKASFDIYVTISKNLTDKENRPLANPIDFRYRINDALDEVNPILIKADAASSLVKGQLTEANEDKIALANHINSKVKFNFEGKDSGDGKIWAKFIYNRIYDVNGSLLNEAAQTKLIKLTSINNSENYYDSLTFDLSDSSYADGMYKVLAYVSDESGNLSSQSSTYYIIRDTSLAYNPNTAISYINPQANDQTITKAKLDYYSNIITFENLNDDLYYTSVFSDYKKPYSDKKEKFTYALSWGLSLSQLSQPVALYGSDFEYELPLAFKNFRLKNSDKDIYLKVSFSDSVGNKESLTSLLPQEIDFFNYEVEDSGAGLKKIKLNFSDLANSTAKIEQMPDKQSSISYRVYYGRIFDDQPKDAVKLKLNHQSANLSEYEFLIEENSSYLVYIQPLYTITSKTNGQWCGQTFGPLYELEVNTISSGEDPRLYSFEVSKSTDGINKGTSTIDVRIINGESDVSYYPCFSTDGKNWNTYKELSFQIENPLKAPLNKGQAWAHADIWKEKSLFEARDSLDPRYSLTAYIRILAVKGNKAVYSKSKEIIFTHDEDNIPPETSDELSSHDSMLSYDGRSFKFDGLVREDDLHTNQIFKYYYTSYDEKWGNNLYFMTQEEIQTLPWAVSRIDSKVWLDSDSNIQYKLSPVIPVNGLKDGKYMFFAKVWDSYGNENYITLGKANVGTFKNKLKVSYDSNANVFASSIKLDDSEYTFDRSMINLQVLGPDNQWYDYYGRQNALLDCNYDLRTRTFSSQNRNIKKGAFYRLSLQGFNDNTYNQNTNTGVNKINPKPYSDLEEAARVVELVPNESEYDLYTEETVSYPVYYYVPAQDEDMSRFKGSFFKNTAAINSNKPVIVNLISSLTDLGSDIDEWERRGKLIKTYYFKGDTGAIPFKDNDVRDDMLNSDEEGLVYYVMVVHFANNSSEISNVYKLVK